MSDNETTLIQKAQKGNHDAFAVLVDEHQRYVYNLALRVVKDENEALDLTQETFVRAWTALPNFKGQSQFRTWLYRIVTNLCYNRLPNLRRSLNDLGDDVMEDIPEPHFNSPASEFESNETKQNLSQAIQNLDANYQLPITNYSSLPERTFLRRDRLDAQPAAWYCQNGHFPREGTIAKIARSPGGLMDNRLKQDALIEEALNSQSLAPMPRSITVDVMARIQNDTRPALITWNDFALSLVIALCVGALFFTLQNLPPVMLAKIRIQGILLYQDFLVNMRWLIPVIFFGLGAFLAALTIPTLYQMTVERRR